MVEQLERVRAVRALVADAGEGGRILRPRDVGRREPEQGDQGEAFHGAECTGSAPREQLIERAITPRVTTDVTRSESLKISDSDPLNIGALWKCQRKVWLRPANGIAYSRFRDTVTVDLQSCMSTRILGPSLFSLVMERAASAARTAVPQRKEDRCQGEVSGGLYFP